jgi:hypothetical protein
MNWAYLTYFLTLFTAILVPIYWRHYGPLNFLWLSDISLFLTLASLWTSSPLFISIAACGIFLLEVTWNVDFFLNLIFRIRTIRLADYMFDNRYSLVLRGLSLFHVLVPIIWITYLYHFGYDQRAWYYFVVMYWAIVIITYLFTSPKENINWVFMPQSLKMKQITAVQWVLILMIGIPFGIALPTHIVLKKIFHAPALNISG